ncbi:SpoIIE family protein phosphatase [Microbacterium trichothecenolyticum]|uniref:Uncharacterized protein n=1 Tax=Microbacterium trichothecenolyticum TaxID=69370 RepID=A0ABU0TVG0_MICTR|nr:GAF domain-containing SpoIIE family protein phosphatase [Microbacterium trichothecenolyticum]MDQ1123636.1 hypothetical protein [Microbacterium trichothecenolyticum]
MVEDTSADDAVARIGLLDTPPEERFDRITRLAKEVFDVDYAVVNVVNSETVYTKSQPPASHFVHTPIADSFCQEAVKEPQLLEVSDGRADPRFADRAIVAEHGMRFYAGIPLRTEDGHAVGTLCLLDAEPGRLDDRQRDAFERFGRWAEAEMRQSEPVEQSPAPVRPDVRDVVGDEVRLASFALPHGAVSGDRSGWQHVDGRVVVTLADVMGKGEAAGRVAEELLAALQELRDAAPLDALVAVEDEGRRRGRYSNTFATVFHAVIDTRSGVVDFVDAGHGLTLVLHADGSTERLSSRNLPLGLRPDDIPWEPGRVSVRRGDLLVSVSDGALDAYDSTLESLRMLADDLRRAAGPAGFFDQLAVRVTAQKVDDDVTAIVASVH